MAIEIKKGLALTSLSITPLIDIVFLLLIFFLVASRFAEEDRELPVSLPSASEAMPLVKQPQEIFINIDKTGTYFIGSKQMDAGQMEQHLSRLVLNNPLSKSAILRADRSCPWDAVAAAINICRRAGVQDVRPATEPGEG